MREGWARTMHAEVIMICAAFAATPCAVGEPTCLTPVQAGILAAPATTIPDAMFRFDHTSWRSGHRTDQRERGRGCQQSLRATGGSHSTGCPPGAAPTAGHLVESLHGLPGGGKCVERPGKPDLADTRTGSATARLRPVHRHPAGRPAPTLRTCLEIVRLVRRRLDRSPLPRAGVGRGEGC